MISMIYNTFETTEHMVSSHDQSSPMFLSIYSFSYLETVLHRQNIKQKVGATFILVEIQMLASNASTTEIAPFLLLSLTLWGALLPGNKYNVYKWENRVANGTHWALNVHYKSMHVLTTHLPPTASITAMIYVKEFCHDKICYTSRCVTAVWIPPFLHCT